LRHARESCRANILDGTGATTACIAATAPTGASTTTSTTCSPARSSSDSSSRWAMRASIPRPPRCEPDRGPASDDSRHITPVETTPNTARVPGVVGFRPTASHGIPADRPIVSLVMLREADQVGRHPAHSCQRPARCRSRRPPRRTRDEQLRAAPPRRRYPTRQIQTDLPLDVLDYSPTRATGGTRGIGRSPTRRWVSPLARRSSRQHAAGNSTSSPEDNLAAGSTG
jgi:hypothetical protein